MKSLESMYPDQLREFCLSFPGVTEDFPFGPETLVFKVRNKVFAITDIRVEARSVNLKCDPEWAIELRESYPEVNPGYHMNKKHWNTVRLNGNLGDEFVSKLISHSYDLVVKGLPRSQQRTLL
jgi:predicted DNA-binding protein (MmcQ/YjbR family)